LSYQTLDVPLKNRICHIHQEQSRRASWRTRRRFYSLPWGLWNGLPILFDFLCISVTGERSIQSTCWRGSRIQKQNTWIYI